MHQVRGQVDTQRAPWFSLSQGRFSFKGRNEPLVRSASTTAEDTAKELPDHLIVLVNGLFGNMSNWDIIRQKLDLYGQHRFFVYTSQANQFTKTFEGIDVCGQRLAIEIQGVIRSNPQLKHISLMGHSLGGVLARYAAGILYDPDTGLMQGLKPRHYVSLASPHMGADYQGPYGVPFIEWSNFIPVVGQRLNSTLKRYAVPIANFSLGPTGSQMFLQDGNQDTLPLIARMATDVPSEGHFLSALRSFRTHTAYANAKNDHIVSWANSCLRQEADLPDLSAAPGDPPRTGILREDPLSEAFTKKDWQEIERHLRVVEKSTDSATPQPGAKDSALRVRSSSIHVDQRSPEGSVQRSPPRARGKKPLHPPHTPSELADDVNSLAMNGTAATSVTAFANGTPDVGKRNGSGAVAQAEAPLSEEDIWALHRQWWARQSPATTTPRSLTNAKASSPVQMGGWGTAWPLSWGGGDVDGAAATTWGVAGAPVEGSEKVGDRAKYSKFILGKLQSMAWRRVDVGWEGASMKVFAHNNIQVTRSFLNWEGDAVVDRLVRSVCQMDDLLQVADEKE